jgi:hypothetical protein
MGTYSEQWEKYRKQSLKWLLVLGLLIVVGLPTIALVSLFVVRIARDLAVHVQLGLLAIWLVVLTWAALRASRVTCPRCGTVYARGKGLINCPQCGLRMLQEEP